MALRSAVLLLCLAFVAPGCGGGPAGAPAPSGRGTPHLAETEVVDVARGHADDLQLAWVKALRVASATELDKLMAADDSQSQDWYLVQACSFQGRAQGYWANPVVHKVV